MPRGNNRNRMAHDESRGFSAELLKTLPQGKKFGIGRRITFESLQEVVGVLPRPDDFRKYSFGAAVMYITSTAVRSRLTNGGVGRGRGREGILEAYKSQPMLNRQATEAPVTVPVRGYNFSIVDGVLKAKLIVSDILEDQGYRMMGERKMAYRLAGIEDPLAPLQQRSIDQGKVPYHEVRIGRYPIGTDVEFALGGMVAIDDMPTEVELLPVSVLK